MDNQIENKLTNLQDEVSNAVRAVIKNISLIVFFVLLGIGTLVAFGADLDSINLFAQQFRVLSVLLIAASMVIYTMWRENGKNDGMAETSFQKKAAEYMKAVEHTDTSTIRKFLTYERKQRIVEFESAIMDITELKRDELYDLPMSTLKVRGIEKKTIDLIKRCRKKKYPTLAFRTAEQLKSLGTLASNNKNGETDITAERHYIKIGFIRKFITLSLLASLGIGVGFTVGSLKIVEGVFVTLIVVITFTTSLVGGYNFGFRQITVVRGGTFKTGTKYLNECERYAKEKALAFKVKPVKKELETEDVKRITDEMLARMEAAERIEQEQRQEQG